MTSLNKEFVARQIKPITTERRDADFVALCKKAGEIRGGSTSAVGDRCRVGNDVVDFFTFEERLNTRSKYDIHFYDFLERIEEFKEKKFIRNMLVYYENVKNKNKTKNKYVVMKEVFNICIGAINIFRPLVAMEVYAKYKPTSVLDICAGWGGRCIGAAAMGVPRYTGLEINVSLREGYFKMLQYLMQREEVSTTMHMMFGDALHVNCDALPKYDMVFTSPPYYFLEKYSHNSGYKNKKDKNERFYLPLFRKFYDGLALGGHFIVNVNKDIYGACCVPLLGEADETLPFKKSKRQNEYSEGIYVWRKLGDAKLAKETAV